MLLMKYFHPVLVILGIFLFLVAFQLGKNLPIDKFADLWGTHTLTLLVRALILILMFSLPLSLQLATIIFRYLYTIKYWAYLNNIKTTFLAWLKRISKINFHRVSKFLILNLFLNVWFNKFNIFILSIFIFLCREIIYT